MRIARSAICMPLQEKKKKRENGLTWMVIQCADRGMFNECSKYANLLKTNKRVEDYRYSIWARRVSELHGPIKSFIRLLFASLISLPFRRAFLHRRKSEVSIVHLLSDFYVNIRFYRQHWLDQRNFNTRVLAFTPLKWVEVSHFIEIHPFDICITNTVDVSRCDLSRAHEKTHFDWRQNTSCRNNCIENRWMRSLSHDMRTTHARCSSISHRWSSSFEIHWIHWRIWCVSVAIWNGNASPRWWPLQQSTVVYVS